MILVPLLLLSCAEVSDVGTPNPRIDVRTGFDDSGGYYIEGFLSYTRVLGQGVDEEVELEYRGSTSIELEGPGGYEITSWVRPCSGNCGSLDAATDHCAGSFRVEGGSILRLLITYRVGTPCRIDVLPTSPSG